MYVGNMGDLSTYRQDAFFDWDVAMMPEGPAKRVVPHGSGQLLRSWPICGIRRKPGSTSSSSSRKKKVDRYSGSRKPPIYKPLALSPEWMERDLPPDKEVFIRSVAYGDPLGVPGPGWNEWHDARAVDLAARLRGKCADRRSDDQLGARH